MKGVGKNVGHVIHFRFNEASISLLHMYNNILHFIWENYTIHFYLGTTTGQQHYTSDILDQICRPQRVTRNSFSKTRPQGYNTLRASWYRSPS